VVVRLLSVFLVFKFGDLTVRWFDGFVLCWIEGVMVGLFV